MIGFKSSSALYIEYPYFSKMIPLSEALFFLLLARSLPPPLPRTGESHSFLRLSQGCGASRSRCTPRTPLTRLVVQLMQVL